MNPHPMSKHRMLFNQKFYLEENHIVDQVKKIKSPFNDSYILRSDVLVLFGETNQPYQEARRE